MESIDDQFTYLNMDWAKQWGAWWVFSSTTLHASAFFFLFFQLTVLLPAHRCYACYFVVSFPMVFNLDESSDRFVATRMKHVRLDLWSLPTNILPRTWSLKSQTLFSLLATHIYDHLFHTHILSMLVRAQRKWSLEYTCTNSLACSMLSFLLLDIMTKFVFGAPYSS
jgi:hypothetical protein